MTATSHLLAEILDGIGESFYAVDRGWRITLFNRHAEAHFGRGRAEVVGRSLWEIVADTGEVAGCFREVMAGGGPRLLEAGSHVRERRMLEGRIFAIPDGMAVAFRDVTEARAAESALGRREAELARVQRIAGVGGLEVDLREGFRNRRSPEYLALHGLPPEAANEAHEEWVARIHPEDRLRAEGDFREAVDGTATRYDAEYRIVRPSDGEVRWIAATAEIERDPAGRPLRLVGAHRDVTERRRYADRQTVLINELNHRVKNTLATVQSIASQSLRAAPSARDGLAAFEGRLLALSRAHDVLTRENWEGADLLDIVAQVVEPYRDTGTDRVRVDGAALRVRPQTALALAMALQELATNAVKYGALSGDSGRVDIAWRVADGTLILAWQESGGPLVVPPTRRGFGSRLIERSLAADLGGEATMTFGPAGLACTIRAAIGRAPEDG